MIAFIAIGFILLELAAIVLLCSDLGAMRKKANDLEAEVRELYDRLDR